MMRRVTRRVTSGKSEPKRTKSESLFDTYKAAENNQIEPEGIERFCNDLGVDPADRKVLILAWKMGAQKMGYFSEAEFQTGLRTLRVTDVSKMKKALTAVEADLAGNPDEFQSFYAFAFRYCLTESNQKIIDLDTAAQMLQVVLQADSPHLEAFTQFLTQQKDYQKVNMDQWMGLLRFIQEVAPDCSNYDESQAWPLLLDNYVEWVRDRKMRH